MKTRLQAASAAFERQYVAGIQYMRPVVAWTFDGPPQRLKYRGYVLGVFREFVYIRAILAGFIACTLSP